MSIEDKVKQIRDEQERKRAQEETQRKQWLEDQSERAGNMQEAARQILDTGGAKEALTEIKDKYWGIGQITEGGEEEQHGILVREHGLSYADSVILNSKSLGGWAFDLLSSEHQRKLVSYPPPEYSREKSDNGYTYDVGLGYAYYTLSTWWPVLKDGYWRTRRGPKVDTTGYRKGDEPHRSAWSEWVDSPSVKKTVQSLSIIAIQFIESDEFSIIVSPRGVYKEMPLIEGSSKPGDYPKDVHYKKRNYSYRPKVINFPKGEKPQDNLEEILAQDYLKRRYALPYSSLASKSLEAINEAGLGGDKKVQEFLQQNPQMR